ncbi:hypothetical protein MATR_25210 [Marivirga tractuosa]|uniref:Inner membrane protein YgaP-like transmembrane domain-containing protein n=1 Tax=Marivirga tractuosa (strain ATCC 23168 / DSM 4126 / NBRC 15989 / NCIMB 1408 / VKM B-1430 / H-43) TaxID=643867 RepID=E4TPT6_MARTH|nr:DUF2892 domain-containing protein [Marivirga tractuosa]ADR23623.1 hypothetical protein Ftrac_3654 [Marivirga tractuosa DSM 4126]BDD15696.1 hypothetical protein MATR_25210 [Marivirga tractuosa]
MKANMGAADKTVRIVLAIAVGGLYFFGVISGTIAIILGILAIIIVASSFISFCLLYYPFGISTRRKAAK